MRLLYRRVVREGMVVVAGAGNLRMDLAGPDGLYGTGDDAIPASFHEVMAVSAMDSHTDRLWEHSNYSQIPQPLFTDPGADPTVVFPSSPGGAINVAAPGVRILTTAAKLDEDGIGRSYRYASGTSLASPHVAGLVALYIAANGRAYDEQGVHRIRKAINRPKPSIAAAKRLGFGRYRRPR